MNPTVRTIRTLFTRLTLAIGLCLAAAAAIAQPAEPNLRITPTVRVFQEQRDAVVNINTSQIIRQRFGLFGDPLFGGLLDIQPFERDVKRTSLGSGFIVHSDGYVVTNAHVVSQADEVEVILADGVQLPARILAADVEHDLAILKVEPPASHRLKAVTLGSSGDLMVGEPAIAIGNPLGYQHTVTTGIVSAVNRTMPVTRTWTMKGLIQTDASINPGNSGGPLFNAYGQVIGINTAIRGDAQNIGFAIPVERLIELAPELLSPTAINQVEVGGQFVETRSVTPPATVHSILQWAADAPRGPRPIITAVNGRPVANVIEACVELLRLREGQKLTLTTADGSAIESSVRSAIQPDALNVIRRVLGAEVRSLTADDRRRLRLGEQVRGLLVLKVESRGPAAEAGLAAGDILFQLGRYRVADVNETAVLLRGARSGQQADVYVIRDGRTGVAQLRLRSASGQ